MAVGYANLGEYENDEDDDYSDEDIDELAEAGKKPLLFEEECENYEPDVQEEEEYRLPLKVAQQRRSGLRWLLGKPPPRRGTCPLCNQIVRSGAHDCPRSYGTLQAGLRSDAERASGNAHFRCGRFAEAVAAYTAALRDTPGDAKVFSNRSAAYSALGDHKRAVADADDAMRMAPRWIKGYYRKAVVCEATQDWDGAAEVYRLLLRNCAPPPGSREHAKASHKLALARAHKSAIGLGQPFSKEAVEERWHRLRNAGAEPVHSDEECRERFALAEEAKAEGNSEVSCRNWADALLCYQRALQMLDFFPRDPSEQQARLETALWLNSALCEIHLGHHAKAAKLSAQVLVLDPTNVKARFRRATSLGEMEEYDAALAELLLAIAFQPADTELLALRRQLQAKRKRIVQRQQAQCARMFGSNET